MRRMWSDLLSWIVGGLMSSSTHAASFCLPICAASLRFQHTYMCFNSLWLLFDLPHLLLGHLQNIFKAPCLLHASGRWKKGKENSCTNNRCVLWSQAATSIFERMVCSQPLTQVNKVCWEKGGKCFLCSNCDTSAHLHVLVGWWLLRFEWLLPFFYFIFFLSTLAMIQSCPCFALPTETMWQLSVHAYVCMFVHTRRKCPIQV